MVLGAVWMPRSEARSVADQIRAIKKEHGKAAVAEIKWNRVSPSAINFYQDVVSYFFSNPDLHFRCLVADKTDLHHAEFGQDHDTWYYKMYFDLLKIILNPGDQYYIYLDIKDTRGASKIRRLHEILCNSNYDFDWRIVRDMQLVRSHEVQQIQIADLLIGAVGYANRDLQTSDAKLSVIARIRECSGYNLTQTTLLSEKKVNIFRWNPKRS